MDPLYLVSHEEVEVDELDGRVVIHEKIRDDHFHHLEEEIGLHIQYTHLVSYYMVGHPTHKYINQRTALCPE